jgi:ribonuclease III
MPSSKQRAGPAANGSRDAALSQLQDRLGHPFARPTLLERALTHPSVSVDRDHEGGDYERLEFLGDRVLGLVVAENLFQRFPQEAEGLLARRLAKLVAKETLASVAEDLGLGGFMRLAMGEEEQQGRSNPGLLSDVCGAVIAALYLDGGLPAAKQLIDRFWTDRIEEDREAPSDPKTALQEWAQARGLPLPRYNEVDRQGPPHDPMFTISVEVKGLPLCSGQGRSKRAAEQDAAGHLLSLAKDQRP